MYRCARASLQLSRRNRGVVGVGGATRSAVSPPRCPSGRPPLGEGPNKINTHCPVSGRTRVPLLHERASGPRGVWGGGLRCSKLGRMPPPALRANGQACPAGPCEPLRPPAYLRMISPRRGSRLIGRTGCCYVVGKLHPRTPAYFWRSSCRGGQLRCLSRRHCNGLSRADLVLAACCRAEALSQHLRSVLGSSPV
jgi:hypothetical protein